MSLDQDRRDLTRKQSNLADTQKKLSTAQSKLSAATKKAADAERQASRTKSDSTRRTKLRTMQNARDDAAKWQKEVSKLQGKIATIQKDIQRQQEKVWRAEKSQRQKEANEVKRRESQANATIMSMDSAIESHEERITALETTPEKITVLYLGTSPLGEPVKLRTDQEARDIHEAIRMSDNSNAIDFQDRWAIRRNDIMQALNETNPTIVHFSGHGAEDGSIVIEDAEGNSELVSKDALAAVVSAAAKQTRLMVFNACFSDEDYAKVLKHVDAVIGMTDSISDEAALAFARQLYSAIGFGRSLQDAFAQAQAAIALASFDEKDIPALHVRNGLDPTEMFFVAPKAQAAE